MATFTIREIVEDLMDHGGRMADQQEDAPDNPRAYKIVEYESGLGGNICWGVVFEGEHPSYQDRYNRETDAIRNPRTIWTLHGGRQ